MSSINTITVTGNLTADPEMRRTAADVTFARLRVAVSHRIFNTEKGEWEDRQDGFFAVTAWRELAANACMSLKKGDRVTVSGRLIRRAYDADVGGGKTETRHVHEIEAEDLGPSLRWRPWARMDPRPLTVVDESRTAAVDAGSRDDDADASEGSTGDVTRAA